MAEFNWTNGVIGGGQIISYAPGYSTEQAKASAKASARVKFKPVESQVINVDGYIAKAPSSSSFKGSRAPSDLSSPIPELDTSQLKRPLTAAEKANVLKRQELESERTGASVLAGVEFAANVFNANSAYNSAAGQAGLNIMMAKNQAADALYRGREAQMAAQSEGYDAGQSALLAMAAQGQDVNSAAVGKIQGSYEAMGIYNGMQEEINSMREALGYELEQSNIKYQLRSAKAARDLSIIGSGLTAGAKIYAANA